jgi:hypothetical protein
MDSLTLGCHGRSKDWCPYPHPLLEAHVQILDNHVVNCVTLTIWKANNKLYDCVFFTDISNWSLLKALQHAQNLTPYNSWLQLCTKISPLLMALHKMLNFFNGIIL